MKLYNLSITEFLEKVDSASATPGGGSVSALAIAEGISLLRMVAHLTISKKKFNELNEDVKLDYMSRVSSLDEIKLEIIELIDKDTEAFNRIMDAFKLPKETKEQVEVRSKAINNATVHATEIPLLTARLACKALELAEPTFTYANKSAISDFGVGVLLVVAGLKGAVLNVKTNMHQYYDRDLAMKYYEEVKELEEKAITISSRLLNVINEEFAI